MCKSRRTLLIDNDIDLTMSLQVLGRLESLRAISIILRLIHLVDSIENDSRTSEADTSARNGNSDISLHGIAGRNTTIRGVLANTDVRDTASFQGLLMP